MELVKKIKSREARIGIIGLGYVGLPLVIRYCEEGFHVVGFDIDSLCTYLYLIIMSSPNSWARLPLCLQPHGDYP